MSTVNTVIRAITHNDDLYHKIALWLNTNGHKPMLDSDFYTYPNGTSVHTPAKSVFTPTDGERFEVALADKSHFTEWPKTTYHRPCVRGVIKNGELTSIEVIEP